MAPLFGQRQKAENDLAEASQNQLPHHHHAVAPDSSIGNGNMSSASVGGNHCTGGDPSNDDGDRARQNGTVPPPLPPLRQQQGPNNMANTTALRKYLVLLHDCLAIKFVPLVNGHQSHSVPFAFNNTRHDNYKNGNSNVSHSIEIGGDEENELLVPHRQSNLRHHRVVLNGDSKCGSNSITEPVTNNNNRSHSQGNNASPSTSQLGLGTLNRNSFNGGSNGGGVWGSSTPEVDHSLHALYLYKAFKEANIQCHWNAALCETFRHIQYKGCIVPSTILVGALPKFLSILRTAWSRQMLRSPAGYRIEFIGEIEEMIADPIQKGQFSPLSDSLCCAILELTSLGQEAFVDSIMSALQLAFPTMRCPSRELVFQTLEKLIKERKVYQTSRGYFVVTPDIFRYMASANFHEFDAQLQLPHFSNNTGITLDAFNHNCQDQDKLSFSHQSWDSTVITHDRNRCSSTSTGEEFTEGAPSPKLKRHNSLKLIRQRDVAVSQMSSSAGHRRHSLRLPKSKSCGRMNDAAEGEEEVKRTKVKSSTIGHISRAMRSLRSGTSNLNSSNSNNEGGECDKSKKNKSLLSKLFPFRRSTSKPRNEKITTSTTTTTATTVTSSATERNADSADPIGTKNSSLNSSMRSSSTKSKHSENAKESAKFISTQTQTSSSTEQLCAPMLTLPSSPSPPPLQPASSSSNSPAAAGDNEQNAGRILTAVDSTAAAENSPLEMMLHHRHTHSDCINGDGSHQTRSSSRRSMSILDEGPLYDVLQDVPSMTSSGAMVGGRCSTMHQISPNFQVGCPVGPPTFPPFHRGESSRCSTLSSQATSSLGYGSQGHPSLTSNYSPNNMESGLVSSYGYYGGDGSVISNNSHSPNGVTPMVCYGHGCRNKNHLNGNYNNNANTTFPQPPKPNTFSSTRYKNSYEWYKKRYPNYISQTGRSSPLYASLTAPRSKSRSRPTCDSLLTTMDERQRRGDEFNHHQASNNRGCVSSLVGGDRDVLRHNIDNQPRSINDTRPSGLLQETSSSGVNTTTVTQAVKSTTNMELELLLPLGKIMKAALQSKKDAIRDAWLRDELGPNYAAYANKGQQSKTIDRSSDSVRTVENGNETIKVNLDNTGARLRVSEPTTKTEVKTVINNNGVIETHFDSGAGASKAMEDLVSRNMKSTVEIQTLGGIANIVLVNGKAQEGPRCDQKKLVTLPPGAGSQSSNNDGNCSSDYIYEKIFEKRPSSSCVKITDIGKDASADEDVIKVC